MAGSRHRLGFRDVAERRPVRVGQRIAQASDFEGQTSVKPQDLPYEQLRLDPENPRVPETVGNSQRELLEFVYDRGSLTELAESMIDNGYFTPERLVVRPEGEAFVVVEGNRRLATLMILHQVDEAEGMRLTDEEPTPDQLGRLLLIPCLILDEGEDVDQYLAYRHIGGLKTWSPEAKARFVSRLVSESVDRGDANVFRAVGRRVGSNAQGVRTPYLALAVLERGRDDLSIPTTYVQYNRFGVWVRCMTSVDIRSFISLGDPRTHEEVRDALDNINPQGLEEIVADLSPRGNQKPVLQDSRDVTDYGRILVDERAHRVLRTHDDLEIAKQVIRQQSLPDRVARVATDVDLLLEEIYPLESLADDPRAHDLLREVERLAGATRTLRSAVRDLIDDD